MPYATQEQLTQQVGEDYVYALAGTLEDGETLNVARIDQALARASAEIDGYLATRYELPVANPPDLLVGYAIDIAVYRLPSDGAAATDEQRQRYEDAVAFLTKVSKGHVNLPIKQPGGEHSHPAPKPVALSTGRRQFSRDKLAGVR